MLYFLYSMDMLEYKYRFCRLGEEVRGMYIMNGEY